MNQLSLIPADLVTQQMLVEVLTAMVKHHIAIKKAVATSEFLRHNVMTAADTLSAQTEAQSDSTPPLYPITAGVNYEQQN